MNNEFLRVIHQGSNFSNYATIIKNLRTSTHTDDKKYLFSKLEANRDTKAKCALRQKKN
jgi:hypothetical protein